MEGFEVEDQMGLRSRIIDSLNSVGKEIFVETVAWGEMGGSAKRVS